jgi:hypothetical protein
MTAVLTTASILLCEHKSPLVLLTSREKLAVDKEKVLVRADLLIATIPACPNPAPCIGVVSIMEGLSTTLFVDGEPVVLASANGATASATWRVDSVNQTKLEAT